MKVLLITHYATLKFGANLSLTNLVQGLNGTGIDCYVIAPTTGELERNLGDRSIPFRTIPFPWWMNAEASIPGRLKRSAQSVLAARKIARFARANNIDIVHSNTSVISVGVLASIFARIPHVWHLREFGDLDHGLEPDLGWRFHRYLVRRSTGTVSVSSAVQRHHLGTWRRQLSQVTLNGVLPRHGFDELLTRRTSCGEFPDKPFTFIIVGHISPNKGQLLAIRALRELVRSGLQARLFVVGEGDSVYTEDCRRFVAENGMGASVTFAGYQKDPFPFYLAADAALVCSANEAMGRVTAEAMAAGLPVIGVNSGGTRELIQDDVTGYLVANDVPAFAKAMAALVTDRAKARELGLRAAKWISAHCSIEQYAAAIRTLYAQIIQDRAAPHGN